MAGLMTVVAAVLSVAVVVVLAMVPVAVVRYLVRKVDAAITADLDAAAHTRTTTAAA